MVLSLFILLVICLAFDCLCLLYCGLFVVRLVGWLAFGLFDC